MAGLVFGAFPIAVDGLERFMHGLETARAWKRYQRVLRNYSHILVTQRAMCLDTIELLFEGIIRSNEELESLTTNPERAVSQVPQYEMKLKKRLGRSYDSYLHIMTELLETLKKAQKEIGIDDEGNVDTSSLLPLYSVVLRKTTGLPVKSKIENFL